MFSFSSIAVKMTLLNACMVKHRRTDVAMRARDRGICPPVPTFATNTVRIVPSDTEMLPKSKDLLMVGFRLWFEFCLEIEFHLPPFNLN